MLLLSYCCALLTKHNTYYKNKIATHSLWDALLYKYNYM